MNIHTHNTYFLEKSRTYWWYL